MPQLLPNLFSVLACPYCAGDLSQSASEVRCEQCGERFGFSDQGQLDLRLCKPKLCSVQIELARKASGPSPVLGPLVSNPAPAVDFSGIKPSSHLSEPMMSYFPRAREAGEFMLNLGCGWDAAAKPACQRAGFSHVGVDIASPAADLLCDAHALPFRDQSFGFVLSIAVLEHIQHPLVAARETCRVLKPGAKFIGTVAFLEPYHSRSYYHHSHLGVINTLETAGFLVEQVSMSKTWDVLAAQSAMQLFPRMPHALSAALVWPLRILHRLWWTLGRLVTRHPEVSELNRLLYGSGAFFFVATKRQERL